MRIAIAGLGTVGCGVIKILQDNAEILSNRIGEKIEIFAISSRTKKDFGVNIDRIKWIDNPLDLVTIPEIDLIVETIGGASGIAKSLCIEALKNGKHIVTANKALIAHYGYDLAEIAQISGKTLAFEAAVAGGIPVIKTLREGLAANKFLRISGILNGTGNYILTNMETTNRDFSTVLKEAQYLGYAEADPSFDIDGIDTAHKIAIMASIAFGVKVNMDDISVSGIRKISAEDIKFASDLGYRIKLLGQAEQNGNEIAISVAPAMIALNSPLANIGDVYNAALIEGDMVGNIMLEGAGAGAKPTASAVVADIIDIARGNIPHIFGGINSQTAKIGKNLDSRYYMRLSVEDKTGVLAEITNIFAQYNISILSLNQIIANPVQIILTTHTISENTLQKTIIEIIKIDAVLEAPQIIRIEE